MAGQLLPPPGMDPPTPDALTPTERIEAWMDLMDTCDQFLMTGLHREVGPEGDVRNAYRRWYAEQMAEHDRTMRRMVVEFNRRWNARVR